MSIVGEVVAGAALSAFFDGLFDKLSSSDLLNIFRQKNVDTDLKKWKRTLLKIHAVLEDAEEKQMTSRLVKIWLDELEDLVYDVDDILDEFATEALRRKLHEEERSTSKIRKFIPACCFNPSSIKFDVSMRSKIEGINTRLQEIVTERAGLKLNDGAGVRTRTTRPRLPSTSHVNEGDTYDRDEDKNYIVELLKSSDAQLSVIPIVGMGGLGKTTLAQLVYKDDEVSRHFELKAWVCVSEDFDNLRLTKEILSSFTHESRHDNNDLDSLQRTLNETLSRKKFLLILDDVWNENYELWTELCKPFESGAKGSKIVVTTRNDGVSSIMGTTPPYKLKELSDDACLRVFTNHALEAADSSEHPKLKKFGTKIVDRCKGVPLAAKALGGLLRNKHNPCEWEDVLESKIWDIPEDKSSIFSVLKLSYHYLPSHLKRCFAYCSLFPKDNEFEEKELVLLWMAEGLVQETKRKKPMEDLGGEYLRDLLKRSFFEQSSTYESRFVMHDLMHDLAQWAAGDLCCRLEVQLGGSKQSEISTKVRHFSYIEHSNDCIQKFDEDVHLRTFLSLPLYNQYGLTNFDVKYCSFPQLRCLRVLSLSGKDIFKLPSSIGDLKHLRYLNLSYTKITILPKSTSSLYNLQTLILKGCNSLTKLPEKIENLVNLRHLDITYATSIIEMPMGIAKLKNLRTLSDFIVGKDKIVDLMNLESLQGTLCISHLENMLDANDARKVNLIGKKNLDTLVMKWNPDLQDAGIVEDILDMLRPHEMMKTLSIEGYVGAKFPTWLGDPSFSNMVDLRIEGCGKCMFLPAFGRLPFLKHLVIKRMDGVQSIGPEFYGEHCEQPFRSLVKLCFKDMNEWKNWIPCRIGFKEFPCLHELSISNCCKLEGKLPHHLPALERLSIYECRQLVVSIPSFSMLQEVKIVSCKEVVHGFGNNNASLLELEISDCQSQKCLSSIVDLVAMLKHLDIENCRNLTSLSSRDTLPTTLKVLRLKICPKLESIVDKLNKDTLLEHLVIYRCEKLRCLPRGLHELYHLKAIDIYECNSIISLGDLLPTNLRSLQIGACEKLEALPNNIHNLCHLKEIDIQMCDSLISLGDLLPTNLRSLHIEACEKLEAWPNNMHNLNFLQDLSIRDCSFPEEGFPTNLRNLKLSGAKLCEQVFELGLHRLTSLTYLSMDNGTMVSFPEEEDGKPMLKLPTSLTELRFENFPNLSFLSWMFFGNHPALKQISINFCPILASLSETCFPPSLRRLEIYDCAVLKQNCKKDEGRMWSKIANIPSVKIDMVEQQK